MPAKDARIHIDDVRTRADLDQIGLELHAQPMARRSLTYGKGVITIYSYGEQGEYGEYVPWASLTAVLGISRATLNGRYNRCNGQSVTVMIPTGVSKPVRAFEYHLLDLITDVVRKNRGVLTEYGASNKGVVNTEKQTLEVIDGTPYVKVNGEQWLTLLTIANHYNVSETTARRRLQAAGLMGKFTPLPRTAPHYGRIRHALSMVYAPAVHAAMTWAVSAAQLEAMALADPELFEPDSQLAKLKQCYGQFQLGVYGCPIELESILNEMQFHISQAEKRIDVARAERLARQVVAPETAQPAPSEPEQADETPTSVVDQLNALASLAPTR